MGIKKIITDLTFSICLLIGISAAPVSAAKLTKADHLNYAQSCSAVGEEMVDEFISSHWMFNDTPDPKRQTEYDYWDAEIKNIGKKGAHIENLIKITTLLDNSGGGWLEKPASKQYYYLHCVFIDAEKGKSPPPAFVILHRLKDKTGRAYVKSLNYKKNWLTADNIEQNNNSAFWVDTANAFKHRSEIAGWVFTE